MQHDVILLLMSLHNCSCIHSNLLNGDYYCVDFDSVMIKECSPAKADPTKVFW